MGVNRYRKKHDERVVWDIILKDALDELYGTHAGEEEDVRKLSARCFT
jgi:hypothetical protein